MTSSDWSGESLGFQDRYGSRPPKSNAKRTVSKVMIFILLVPSAFPICVAEAAVVRREKMARQFEADGHTIAARESYFIAALLYGSAQWSIHENARENREANALFFNLEFHGFNE